MEKISTAYGDIPNVIVQLLQLSVVFGIDRIIVLEAFGNPLVDPEAELDARFVRLRQMLKGLFELNEIEALIVERQTSEDDCDIGMAPFRGWRWNAFGLFQRLAYR